MRFVEMPSLLPAWRARTGRPAADLPAAVDGATVVPEGAVREAAKAWFRAARRGLRKLDGATPTYLINEAAGVVFLCRRVDGRRDGRRGDSSTYEVWSVTTVDRIGPPPAPSFPPFERWASANESHTNGSAV